MVKADKSINGETNKASFPAEPEEASVNKKLDPLNAEFGPVPKEGVPAEDTSQPKVPVEFSDQHSSLLKVVVAVKFSKSLKYGAVNTEHAVVNEIGPLRTL